MIRQPAQEKHIKLLAGREATIPVFKLSRQCAPCTVPVFELSRECVPCIVPVFEISRECAPYTTPPIITTIDSGL
jgi:hypothetical protein